MSSTNSRKRSRPKLVARADCLFPNGEIRRLFATELDCCSAFILAMRPPPLGTELTINLSPAKYDALPPIQAQVVGAWMHPVYSDLNGFEVMFVELNETMSKHLKEIGLSAPPSWARRPRKQIRQKPRVTTDLDAIIELYTGNINVRVHNISMSGALLGIDPEKLIQIDIAFPLTIVKQTAPESVTVNALWVRNTSADEPHGIGVRFVDVTPIEDARIEGLVLTAILNEKDET